MRYGEFGVGRGFSWLIVWFGFCRGMLVYYSICNIRTSAALCAYPVAAPSVIQPITPTMT